MNIARCADAAPSPRKAPLSEAGSVLTQRSQLIYLTQ